MQISRSHQTGRRTFDRTRAVEIAMRLFRRHGYEGVSIADLTEAIGVAPQSLYAAFGSKANLYRKVLDHYAALPGALSGMEGAQTVREAVSGLLKAAIEAALADELGCMISTGLIECAFEHGDLARELANRRSALRERIAQVMSTWLSRDDAERLAGCLTTILFGLAVQARDGASRREMELISEDLLEGIMARRGARSELPTQAQDGTESNRPEGDRSARGS